MPVPVPLPLPVHTTVLHVRLDNAKAIALYESLGFIRAAYTPHYYEDCDMDAYQMIRHFTPT